MPPYRELMNGVGTVIDTAGVIIIVAGALRATGRFLFFRKAAASDVFKRYRQDLGRAILLGLEFLIAGDIIRTIVVSPTLQNVFILGIIVLIRTFLSITLQLEVEGRWPWQRPLKAQAAAPESKN